MNIVTIDFDIIMQPSIELYNDVVGIGEPVANIVKDFPFLEHTMPADFYSYEYLSRYVIACSKKDIPIDFIINHNDVVPIVRRYKEEYINLINIDHHHDVLYDEDEEEDEEEEEIIITPGIGDWVKYLKDNHMIKTYKWVNNSNSFLNDVSEPYIDEIIELKTENLKKLSEKTDYLIICKSPEWVPPVYQSLYEVWESMVEQIRVENANF